MRLARAARTVTCAWLAAECLHPVMAAEGDPLGIGVFASQRYDSNLFRLPDGVSPEGDGRRSAITRTLGVGLNLDKTYSLQHFALDARLTRDRYDPYDNLDFTGREIASSIDWSLTPALSGKLAFNHRTVPSDFADVGFQQRPNPAKSEEKRLDVDWRPGASLHPRFSIFEVEDKSERPVFQRENSRATSGEVSLIYEFRSGNKAEVYGRRARGNYVDINADPSQQIDSQFDEREIGLRGTWEADGVSKLDGQLGYLARDHANFSSRDFDGLVGQVRYVYTPTGKTSLQFTASRSLSSSQSAISSYFQEDQYAISPAWYATGKITVKPSFTVGRRTFKGAPVPVADTLRETTRASALQIDWAALRTIDVSFALTRTARSSNDANLQYVDRSASVFARLKF